MVAIVSRVSRFSKTPYNIIKRLHFIPLPLISLLSSSSKSPNSFQFLSSGLTKFYAFLYWDKLLHLHTFFLANSMHLTKELWMNSQLHLQPMTLSTNAYPFMEKDQTTNDSILTVAFFDLQQSSTIITSHFKKYSQLVLPFLLAKITQPHRYFTITFIQKI